MFDYIYNIIPMTEEYELGQSILSLGILSHVSRYASTLLVVDKKIQRAIPVDPNTLRIHPV